MKQSSLENQPPPKTFSAPKVTLLELLTKYDEILKKEEEEEMMKNIEESELELPIKSDQRMIIDDDDDDDNCEFVDTEPLQENDLGDIIDDSYLKIHEENS